MWEKRKKVESDISSQGEMRTKSSNLFLWDPPKTSRSRRSEAIKALRGKIRFHTFLLCFLFLNWKQPIYRAFIPGILMQRSILKGDYLTPADHILIVSLLYWISQYDLLPSAEDTFGGYITNSLQVNKSTSAFSMSVYKTGWRHAKGFSLMVKISQKNQSPPAPMPAPTWWKAEIN